jgi:gamma-glutamyltranspeptidase/glutathione hydrolase
MIPAMKRMVMAVALAVVAAGVVIRGSSEPLRAKHGMVVSVQATASKIGADVLKDGGNAIDAAVAVGFALAVTHPTAGNLGGGGFFVYRPATGEPVTYDFREMAPAKANPTMFLKDGTYSADVHHRSHIAVGVPGTVAGMHMAWKAHGKLPWKRLVEPAIALARDGFPMTENFARSLADVLPSMKKYPASVAQFSKNGVPYEAGEIFKQPDLAKTLQRIADKGPAGFYEGETAALIEKEMAANGGLITREDLKNYVPKQRVPVRGTYRGYDIISMPPISSGGVALIEMLNILEGYDLAANGYGSAQNAHLIIEAMRRAYADRARFVGDPDFNPDMPVTKLISKEHAAALRKTISPEKSSKSTPTSFEWPAESDETTHYSVVDGEKNAVSVTYTLEAAYGSKITVPGAGFLLNNEMGDFNAGPGLTNDQGLIGTDPNLAAPKKRMLSSMTPTIIAKDGQLVLVTGSPGGRTIINTVLHTVLYTIDFGMNVQEAVDAPRFHHQWLPDRVSYEKYGFSADTLKLLESRGHTLQPMGRQGMVEAIAFNPKTGLLEAGVDGRDTDGAAYGLDVPPAAAKAGTGSR